MGIAWPMVYYYHILSYEWMLKKMIRRVPVRGLVLYFLEKNSKEASTTQLSLYMHTLHAVYVHN
jgi:hypothetical protein